MFFRYNEPSDLEESLVGTGTFDQVDVLLQDVNTRVLPDIPSLPPFLNVAYILSRGLSCSTIFFLLLPNLSLTS